MSYTKTKFHKKVFDSANGMHRCFLFYMLYNDSEYYSYRYPEVFNLLISVNNALSKRGLNKEKRIALAKKTIHDKLNYKYYHSDSTLEEWYKSFKEDSFGMKLIKQIEKWENISESNYEEYVKEIITWIEYLDNIHFDWKVDGEIVFEKSPYTRISRTYSLSIHDSKENERFKKIYKDMISVNDDEFDNMCDVIYDYYSVLETTINSIVRKEYKDVLCDLNEYFEDCTLMDDFKDIYIKSSFNKLKLIKDYLEKEYYDKANKELRKIIELENYKFNKYKFRLFKLLQVDLKNDMYQIPLSKAISDYEKYTKKFITD